MESSAITLDEILTGIVWAALTIGSVRVALNTPRGRRGTWVLVALFCGLFVADKLIDVQTTFYEAVRWLAHLAISQRVREGANDALRYALLLPLTGLALAGVVWLVRRDRYIDGPKRLALVGICGIMVYVGLRLLPPLAGKFDGFTGWLVELPCASLVFIGIRSGLRGRHLGRPGRKP